MTSGRHRACARCAAALWLVLAAGLAACSDRPAPAMAATVGEDASGAAVAARQARDLTGAIREALAALPTRLPGPSPTERTALEALYRAQADAPLWVDASGRLGSDAREALGLLSGAAAEGLDPADYRATELERLAALIDRDSAVSGADLAAFDVGLSLGTIRYFRHLHTGRVNPNTLGFRIPSRTDEHDFAALVRDAVKAHRVRAAAEELTPPLAIYRSLREALQRYERLAENQALVPPVLSEVSIHPGEPYAGVVDLQRLLAAVGDIPADTPAPTTDRYEGVLVDGVKRFQGRHGLAPDGVLGRGTQQALRVPMAARVKQIQLSLERLRWLPDIGDGPLIGVNIPMFRMWMWDSAPKNPIPTFSMGVIVGRALRTETPIFIQEMRSVIFRPYWNVPLSIARNEIVPAIQKDPAYLDKENMEIVDGQGDSATPVALSEESLARVARGELRIRQRPGGPNALGLIKFVFPNDENVYMHGTPAPQLFAQSRRDFSHGCIRLEDPVGLAEWVLKDQPAWTRERIVAAMQGSENNRSVTLSTPVQVVLFYVTAAVMPEDGSVRFADDIYRHDAALERALARP